MLQGVHLISSNIPGYGKSKERCVPCLRASGMGAVSCYTYRDHFKPFPPANTVSMKNLVNVSKKTSFVCSANFGNQKRNSDFSRQNRQHSSYIRNKNRQNTERENFGNLEESELLSSKNGSLSGSTPYQQIAVPGEREKEIVELFRKVQVQLRQRNKKKVEAASQATGKEDETINTILKLLRKNSADKGKRRSDSSFISGDDLVLNQQEQKRPLDEEHNTTFETNNSAREEAQEPNANAFKRPPNFQHRSPVPRVKYQPVRSVQKSLNSVPASESKVTRKAITDELVLDQQEQKKPFDEHNTTFETNNSAREEAKEPNASAFKRPPSIFRRRSPVPRVKYQSVIPVQKSLNSVPASESKVTRKVIEPEPEHELEPELELDPEPKSMAETVPDIEPYLPSADMHDEYDSEVSEFEFSDPDEAYSDRIVETPSSTDNTDLSALKVAELRVLAKSRGLKGFSRMKKGELVELLAGDSS